MNNLLSSFTFDTNLMLSKWQWAYLIGILLAAYIIAKVFDSFARFLLNKKIPILKRAPDNHLKKFINPMGRMVMLIAILFGLQFLELNSTQQNFFERIIQVVFSIFAVWVGHYLVHLVTFFFTEKASRTDSKFDDILIPLISKTGFVIVYTVGIVYILHCLTINVTGIVAGLGIGGLAFAFAAKDTIANLFGSAMLVLDRPFDIGDYVVVGNFEGTVTEVGFRSTRIRTFYDSIVTMSNGQLMNTAIDNKGKRRYRRLVTTLGVQYDTSPEKIEAFCEAIRQLILEHKWTRKDNFHVYFTNFGASSLDISVIVFWTTDDYAREQAEKHRLMVDILRVAKDLEVEFAFPTQTVHLFNENKPQPGKQLDKYLDEAITMAKSVVNKPLSLKNPRSNAEDENQFGKNDIGL